MASIQKRDLKFIVHYDEPGHIKRVQKSKSFSNEKEAKLFKSKIEYELMQWKLENPNPQASDLATIPENNMTVADYIARWMPIYARKNWSPSMYKTSKQNITLHLLPYLGEKPIQKVTPKDIEELTRTLAETKVSGWRAYNKPDEEIPYLSSSTVRRIFNLTKVIFDGAYKDGIVQESPFMRVDKPKAKNKKRAYWTWKMTRKALAAMKHDDSFLHTAVHLTFICTGRNGEVVGLTWDCVDFERGCIKIEKTLQRIGEDEFPILPKNELFFVFPKKVSSSKSLLVLKSTKTDESVREIYLTKELTRELETRWQIVQREKEYLGSEYNNYNLVFCLENGDPIEPKLMVKKFQKWQNRHPELDLPLIDFHGLRHAGATYVYQVAKNNIQAVLPRSGHVNEKTAYDYVRYDEDEKIEVALALEEFYESSQTPEEKTTQWESDLPQIEDKNLLTLLQNIKNDPPLARRVIEILAK